MSGRIALTREQLLGHKCRAYADGARSALEVVVEGLQLTAEQPELVGMTGPEAAASIAADMANLVPVLLADMRQSMAEKAGIEL